MISLQNLNLYVNDRAILKNLNCQFKNQQFWGVIGKNGLGKTTLLNAIAGLDSNYDGDILLDEKAINKIDPISRAQRISYLLQIQEPSLDFTVLQAVSMGLYPWKNHPDIDLKKIIQQAIDVADISHLKNKSILKLSGGERRKVEIATCLCQNTDHLLLDEPLNHLDMVFKQKLLTQLAELKKTKTLIMVCHDLDVVKKFCSHVLMIFSDNCHIAGRLDTILTDTNINALFNDSKSTN
ncbi:MAG: ABC transporter ATP-binding protein [Proteobacteria bacterium]|nr:ABC transporter ATP-binding protein [Pseudomonadota bacterium]